MLKTECPVFFLFCLLICFFAGDCLDILFPCLGGRVQVQLWQCFLVLSFKLWENSWVFHLGHECHCYKIFNTIRQIVYILNFWPNSLPLIPYHPQTPCMIAWSWVDFTTKHGLLTNCYTIKKLTSPCSATIISL